ncbi:hypothetical protein N7492_006647 [Penicillium capsulatum]|uniref:C2 domain-containing protein n=1 Tax=Penicillium capsulatum TaxID=69766 RepID=A0A9W9LKK8_9EURO|nr:hypothetical protein N7492_006647 [Penicillium capsulatum]KAJ6116482.1 hypothetical protein N7512_006207 [Penicillium capsulatum]
MSKLSKVNHAAGIFADMSVDGPPIGTLVAIIDRAKNLPNRKTMGKQNPYCAARLGKEAKKTQTDLRGGQTPRWDHELRFTVHESPDYFRLKVSVFNDDKKTDLIGETWVDLQNLIIPGGSQNDHWHPLQCRGKYCGEIRIEMTFYDTREQDEAVIEKRKEAAERVQNKSNGGGPSTSGLSGPRQPNPVKRRPLPSGPAGATPPRSSAPEQAQSAPPLHHPMPSRPPIREHAHTVPAASGPDSLPYPPRHSEPTYDAPSYNLAPSVSHGGHEASDHHQREWEAPSAPPALPATRQNNHEAPYAYEMPEPSYDSRPPQPRSHSDYDAPPMREYRSASPQPPFEDEIHGGPYHDYGAPSHEPFNQLVSPQYKANPMTFGHVSTFSPRNSAYVDEPAPLKFARPSSSSGPGEDPRYQHHHTRALQHVPRHDSYHPEYATMQPRVEDEDEDGPPPPPPVHRSRMAQAGPPAQTLASQSGSSYTPYNPPMPASLVAGHESEDQMDIPMYEDRSNRRRSSHFDDEMMITQPTVPASASMPAPLPAPVPYEAPSYPVQASPQPIDERASLTGSRGGSNSPETRLVTRKSVSPLPSSSSDRGSNPFSPDSYNTLNPHASRPSSRDTSPAYESPSQGRGLASRPQIEPVRDLDQPIIGDDGREIDPSDHLPTETWAPEPEKKNRKPEVIIRFKHSARPTSRGNDTPSRNTGPPRVGFRTTPETSSYGASKRYTPTQVHTSQEIVGRTPPPMQENYGNYSRGYNSPASTERPRSSHRGSVSPTPSARSPLYDYSPGPPIPSKVPISQGPPSYPVSASNASTGNPGMDALSRELKTIDIGSAGCSPSRAVRKYVPRPPASMGYAS